PPPRTLFPYTTLFRSDNDVRMLLANASTRREAMVDKGLRFTRRAYAGGTLYFILNRGNAPFEGWVPLASSGRSAAIFDPLTGEAGLTQSHPARGGQEIYLQLAPGESCVVKTFDAAQGGQSFPYFM